MTQEQFIHTATPARAAMTGTGATVIDMSADPYDLSPAVNHIVTTVKDALASDQKVILMLGEAHDTVADVRMAELVRVGLRDEGIENPVITLEQRYNLLESFLTRFFPADSLSTSNTHTALSSLKTAAPARYRHLQVLAYLAWGWTETLVTRQENFSKWKDDGLDVRMIDMALTTGNYLDCADPATKDFIDARLLSDTVGAASKRGLIHAGEKGGVRLRNEWMAAQLWSILAESGSRAVILQTGFVHLGGSEREGDSYVDSLHGIFAKVANDNIKVISVFPESVDIRFVNFIPKEAREAMNNSDTIVLRGRSPVKHVKSIGHWTGTFEEEIETLSQISGSSFKPRIKTEDDYNALLEEYRRRLKEEVRAVIEEFAPEKAKKSRRPEYI